MAISIRFGPGTRVMLPQALWKGSRREGSIVDGVPNGIKGEQWYEVKLEPPTVRYRQRNPDTAETTIFIREKELRLKVLHPDCPNCQCTRNDEEEDDEEEDD
jgi:hypothetical protein